MNGRATALILVSAWAMGSGSIAAASAADRWYSASDVARGQQVFEIHCVACHGARAQGGSLGAVEVPALDGSGHSAHHGLDYLLTKVAAGSAGRGGIMPAFANVLADPDRRAAIAFVQSLWAETVYSDWQRHQAGAD